MIDEMQKWTMRFLRAIRRGHVFAMVVVGLASAPPSSPDTVSQRIERIRARIHETDRSSTFEPSDPARDRVPVQWGNWGNQWGNWNNWNNWRNWNNWANWSNWGNWANL